MKTKLRKKASAPLEIHLLETQVKQFLTRQVRIWDKNRTPLETQVKQSPTGRRFLTGSVLVMSVFVIALVSALVIGILQINMSEVWLTQHRVNAAQALAVAEAGLNDALAQIRQDRSWATGFEDKELAAEEDFAGGQYSVDVNANSNTITVMASTDEWQGYTASLEAQITVSDGNSPYIIRIDNVKLNE